ncbi:MAG: glycosyltransferase [Eubacteriales bacterium]|nr:glycosyltransferase [Eubacteriales bacterium]
MSNSNLISVIVPIYKVEKLLDRCVESIVCQTYPKLEIILVDDGSPDRCPNICDEWAKKDPRIRVIHKQNGGLSDARNAGIELAKGEFIGFVDADDWIAPEMYERLLKAMLKDHSDIAACSVEMIWEDNTQNRMLTQQNNCVLNKREAQMALLNESKLKDPVWYKLYRKKTIEGIAFAKGKYHEDVFWSYQAIGNADSVSIIDYVGYYYWQRRGSIMGEKYSLKRLDAVEGKCNRQEYLKEHFPELESKGLVDLWFSCMYQGQAALKELSGDEIQKVFQKLDHMIGKYPITKKNLMDLKKSHRFWVRLAKISLIKTCKIRNALKIGM